MSTVRRFLAHHRGLVLLAIASVIFGLWFAMWVRVLPLKPQRSWPWPAPFTRQEYGIAADGQYFSIGHGVSSSGQFLLMSSHEPRRESLGILRLASGEKLHLPLSPAHAGGHKVTSPDGTRLACTPVVDEGPTAPTLVFDLRSGKEVLRVENPCEACLFSDDGKYLAVPYREGTNGREITIYEAATLRRVLHVSGCTDIYHSGFWFSPDGRRFVYVHGEEGTELRCVDIESGRQLWAHEGTGSVAAFSPDGALLAVAEPRPESAKDSPGRIRILDALTGRVLRTLAGHTGGVGYLFFSDDTALLTALGYGSARSYMFCDALMMWRVSDWSVKRRIDPNEQSRTTVYYGFRGSFEWNARREVGLTEDGKRLLLDIETGEVRPRSREDWHARSEDGKYEVWSEERPVQRLLASWLNQLSMPGSQEADVESVLFSRDLQTGAIASLRRGSFDVDFLPKNQGLLVLTDERIEVWDFAPRRPIVLLLALAAVPSLLFTLILWWRFGR